MSIEFSYKARNKAGKIEQGFIEAKDRNRAANILKRRNLYPVSIVDASDDLGGEQKIIGSLIVRNAEGQIAINMGEKKAGLRDVIIFSKQLSTMLLSGVPLIQGLDILAGQQPSKQFGYTIKKIKKKIEDGATLSDALSDFPREFGKLYTALVRAGESSGSLDTVLLKIVMYLERQKKIQGQLKSATMYPMIVSFIAVAVFGFLMAVVVPQMANTFKGAGLELPGITKAVIWTSDFIVANWMYEIAVIAGGLFGTRFAFTNPKTRPYVDLLLLKVPLIGPLLLKIGVSRFCQTMATMLASGVNILDSLDICAESAGNDVLEKMTLDIKKAVSEGSSFAEPLAEAKLFPKMVVSMVDVGERSGSLDEMLQKVSSFYEEEVDEAIDGMIKMIEPIMICVLGAIIGFILIGMFLPIFDMGGAGA